MCSSMASSLPRRGRGFQLKMLRRVCSSKRLGTLLSKRHSSSQYTIRWGVQLCTGLEACFSVSVNRSIVFQNILGFSRPTSQLHSLDDDELDIWSSSPESISMLSDPLMFNCCSCDSLSVPGVWDAPCGCCVCCWCFWIASINRCCCAAWLSNLAE